MDNTIYTLLKSEIQFNIEIVVSNNSFKKVREVIMNYFGNSSDIQKEDSEIKITTPKMIFNDINIKIVQKFFSILSNKDNIRIKLFLDIPKFNNIDMLWIVSLISIDNIIIDKIKDFQNEYKDIKCFINDIDINMLDNLKYAIENHNFDKIEQILSESKLFRNTLYNKIILDDITNMNLNSFFVHFYDIIKYIILLNDKNEIYGIDKSNYLNMIEDKRINIKNDIKISNLIDKIKENPLILAKMGLRFKPKIIDEIIDRIGKKEFINLLTILRYKKFNNKNILNRIIEIYPKFKDYIEM